MKHKNRLGYEAKWAVFWLAVYLLSMIPVLMLGMYNYPCADDYGYSITTRWAWADTHNIFSVLTAAGQKAVDSWHTWQGTFSSIFLMALQPGIFGERFYAVTPWLMTGLLSLSIFFLFRTFFTKCLNTGKWSALSVSCVYLLFGIQCMIDPTQGIYWYNGASHYMLPQAALFTLTALGLKLTVAGTRREKLCLAGAMLLSVYIGGGNLVTGLECGIWLITGIVLLRLLGKRRESGKLLFPLAAWIISYGLNAAAPGNWIREEAFSATPGAVKSVILSFYYCLEFFSETWHSWVFWAFLLLMAPLAVQSIQRYSGSFTFPRPLLVPVYSFCILSSMFTPSLYASGVTGAGRIYNIIWLTFLALLVLNIVYLYGWYWKKYGGRPVEDKDDRIFRLSALGIISFCAVLYTGVDRNFFTSVSALQSIVTGEAAEYRAQEEKRLTLLLDETEMELAFPEYTVKPYLLFYEDIESHPRNWKNRRMTEYYRKKSIVLIESGEEE